MSADLSKFLVELMTGHLPPMPQHADYEAARDGIHSVACLKARVREMDDKQLVDELTYINYAHNRDRSPHVTPERWAALYPNAEAMEKRYQAEKQEAA